ncbi:putative acetyltransferase [Bradyrhizobium japonicum]|jgi:putative acetyltransferase|uniref:GNAT family N-acetyltransferase n=1 Tax=Bradyrhizobium TaxID=374 RepID=UPI000481E5A1|nr:MULTISPECIES: N-acetyltransferase [Bradyrhizobium]MBR0883199.1 N-acetyltransferase [Bradyrhizobium liaoningense]MBR0947678.1 N-acetyltransferase [Bradyrhizobium liaoningense]MBR1003283.1 N-acetyltransferase [Bradyrhizobium liaoningense]MBR1031295.1 N-acetyltransferase [Bradyrhizobium liaoningense]MBR1067798.1 N-acetyltransferase [Bradyrhizobium liaoningense]
MIIRPERPTDTMAIRTVVTAAFRDASRSDGNEADIVDALRIDGTLAVSLVAEDDAGLVGHVAFSPVAVNSEEVGWFGLGPVAVLTAKRRRGVGAALIEAGLKRLDELGARGCVVLGDPAYYRRFGFESDCELRFADVPSEYFQRLVIDGEPPRGLVNYSSAFYGR